MGTPALLILIFIIFIHFFTPSHTFLESYNEELMTRSIEEFKLSIFLYLEFKHIYIYVFIARKCLLFPIVQQLLFRHVQRVQYFEQSTEVLERFYLILMEKQAMIPLFGDLLLLTLNIFEAQKESRTFISTKFTCAQEDAYTLKELHLEGPLIQTDVKS